MDLEFVVYEKRDRIARVTLNRPEVMNAMHPPAYAELDRIWEDYVADDDLWVAILTGAGDRAFCAGADLKYKANADSADERYPVSGGGHILDTCWKPIICAINGYALGGGLQLALRCDILVAAEDAKLGLPEGKRGQLDDTGAVKLPRRIPYHQAMGLLLTGRFISGTEAARLGLVNEAVPRDDLMPAAERWAAQILENSPLSVRATKQAAVALSGLPIHEALERVGDLDAVKALRSSEDTIEGPRAFSEKRAPLWKGK